MGRCGIAAPAPFFVRIQAFLCYNRSMLKETQRLIDIMARLRDPENGCPWDLKQDFKSIGAYTLEEAYEVVDAIDDGDMDKLKDELGDLLLQVVFHAQMAQEKGLFGFEDIAEIISEKMERRHPHIFGDVSAETADEVLKNWEDIKAAERAGDKDQSALAGVTKALPALARAEKISKRAARIGFEWPDYQSVLKKLDEELGEFDDEIKSGDQQRKHEEFGDVLFVMVQMARWQKIDPETAMKDANNKFEKRFRSMEALANAKGLSLSEMSDADMDDLWIQVKHAEAA